MTVRRGEQETGMLASWVQQCSFEPPLISVALRKGRPAAPLVEAAGCFVLNLIGPDPGPMFRHFGRGFTLDQNAFAGLDCMPTEYGIVIRSCLAHLGCALVQRVDAGDHDLYLARVESASNPPPGQAPYVHTRNSGFSY